MKNLKNWEQFFEKNYTAGDKKKDSRRIEDMQEKSRDKDHLLRLAQTMANRITSYDKAYNRGLAAEEQGLFDVADIFFDRADELSY